MKIARVLQLGEVTLWRFVTVAYNLQCFSQIAHNLINDNDWFILWQLVSDLYWIEATCSVHVCTVPDNWQSLVLIYIVKLYDKTGFELSSGDSRH